ncbi:MAG: hypothetical protein AAGF11_19715 [Myxococcota bacterium]
MALITRFTVLPAVLPTLRTALLTVMAGSGCSQPLQYESPPGFAIAEQSWRSAHYKASDNVGLKLLVFDNVEGGTLEYWGQDLTHKLRARGYTLEGQSPLRAENKVVGTRFDFGLAHGDDHGNEDKPPQFLVVSLYVTDDYRYVAQLAGDQALFARYDDRVDQLLAGLRPKGCRVRSTICRGSQPPPLAYATPIPERSQ